ncbi:MAG: tubulin-like doman-containing protein, partial [bacterium]
MIFRPSMVIGLGGSGKWLIAHLKRALLELNEGKVPPEVVLLALDVSHLEERPIPQVSIFNPSNYAKESVFANATTSPPEFLDISHFWAEPILNILNISTGRRPNPLTPFISKWLSREDAEKYNLSISDAHNKGGAGQKRQASRVSLFLNAEKIWKLLDDRLQALSKVAGAGGQEGESPRINFFV